MNEVQRELFTQLNAAVADEDRRISEVVHSALLFAGAIDAPSYVDVLRLHLAGIPARVFRRREQQPDKGLLEFCADRHSYPDEGKGQILIHPLAAIDRRLAQLREDPLLYEHEIPVIERCFDRIRNRVRDLQLCALGRARHPDSATGSLRSRPDLLEETALEGLVQITIAHNLASLEQRELLLAKLPRGFVAGLPIHREPDSQVRGDLLIFNVTPKIAGLDRSPLAVWLRALAATLRSRHIPIPSLVDSSLTKLLDVAVSAEASV